MNTKNTFYVLAMIAIISWAACSKGPNPGPGPGYNPAPPTAAFNNIVVNGFCKVTLVPGASNKIDSLSGALVNHVIGNTLFINGAGRAIVSISDVDTLVADGSTYLIAPNTLNLDNVVIVGNGVSKMNLNLSASNSIIAISNGVGPYEYSGSTPKLHIHSNGVGGFRGFNLLSQDCIVGMAGVGSSEVYASNSLKVSIAGTGSVYYMGNPPVVDTVFIAGPGRVVKK